MAKKKRYKKPETPKLPKPLRKARQSYAWFQHHAGALDATLERVRALQAAGEDIDVGSRILLIKLACAAQAFVEAQSIHADNGVAFPDEAGAKLTAVTVESFGLSVSRLEDAAERAASQSGKVGEIWAGLSPQDQESQFETLSGVLYISYIRSDEAKNVRLIISEAGLANHIGEDDRCLLADYDDRHGKVSVKLLALIQEAERLKGISP